MARLPLPVAMELVYPGGAAAPPAVPQATHWRQPSAADAEYLQASAVPYAGTAGTIIAPLNVTGIGSSRGGILHLTESAESAYLAIIPGSPDVLRGHLDIGGTPTTVDIAYSADDDDLYDGFPKVAWMRWTNGGTLEVGWNDPAGSLNDSASCGGSLAGGTATVSVGNSGGSGGSIGGEFEAALFDRSLSDLEIQGVLAASTLRSLAPGDAVLYPQPATGVVEDDIITTPATQVVDEAAYTYAIITTDGLAPLQAAGDISDVGRFIAGLSLSASLIHVGQTLTATVDLRGTGAYTLTYQWLRDGLPVSGATGAESPIIATSEEGTQWACRVALTSGGGTQTATSPICQVYTYGLQRTPTTADYLTTSGAIAPQAGMTLIALAAITATDATRGALMVWGLAVDTATAGDKGSFIQIDPTGSDVLQANWARAGVTTMATASTAVPGGVAADGTERLYWSSVSADGLTGSVGVDAGTPATAAITGGIDTATAGLGAAMRRTTSGLWTASSSVVAVLGRAWSTAEAAAIANASSPREALIEFLLAEDALGNVLWWPISKLQPGATITTAADLADVGSSGVAIGVGGARLVSAGP